MGKMIVGTGVYVDFPTMNGNIYTREAVVDALNDQSLKRRLSAGDVIGGILDPIELKPINGTITHRVIDIRLYKDEIIIEIETIDDPKVEKLLKKLKHPEAAITLTRPQTPNENGITINKIDSIQTAHLRERKNYVPSEV